MSSLTTYSTTLTARTGPHGAQASVQVTGSGPPGTAGSGLQVIERDAAKLREQVLARQTDKDALTRGVARGDGSVRLSASASWQAGEGTTTLSADVETSNRRAGMIRSRLDGMYRALARLQVISGSFGATNATGSTMVAITGLGNASAVSVHTTGTVGSVRTGMGSDAIAISGDVVRNVETDTAPGRQHRPGPGVTTTGRAEPASDMAAGGNDAISIDARVIDGVHSFGGADALALRAVTVQSIHSGAGNDAVSIRAQVAESIYTGTGSDAVSIAASHVSNLYTEEGDDMVSIHAGTATGLYTGDGNDSVSIDVVMGASRGYAWTKGETVPGTGLAATLVGLQTNVADLHLGAGDDIATIRSQEGFTVSGGRGDDVMVLSGIVGLHYSAGDGNDTVVLESGATLALQLDRDAAYTATWDDDALVIATGGGSIRIENAANAAGIGVMHYGDTSPDIVHAAAPVDTSA